MAILIKSFEALALLLTSIINHLIIIAIKPYEKSFNVSQRTRLDPTLNKRSGNRYRQYQNKGRKWTCYIYEEERHILF